MSIILPKEISLKESVWYKFNSLFRNPDLLKLFPIAEPQFIMPKDASYEGRLLRELLSSQFNPVSFNGTSVDVMEEFESYSPNDPTLNTTSTGEPIHFTSYQPTPCDINEARAVDGAYRTGKLASLTVYIGNISPENIQPSTHSCAYTIMVRGRLGTFTSVPQIIEEGCSDALTLLWQSATQPTKKGPVYIPIQPEKSQDLEFCIQKI